ncbi:TIGR01212 family radical SAM protein [bacterium]|nr:MAG: TIGR01212 family radical SAM protein [bacterium]
MTKPYTTLSEHLKDRWGEKVFKVTIDAGFTCPNRDGTRGVGGCVYCLDAALQPLAFNGNSIEEQLDAGIKLVRKRHHANKFIAYYQLNTNTYGSVTELEKIYKPALENSGVSAIAVSTRPDCLEEDVLELLCKIKLKKPLWVELGLQSSNDATLERVNRGHTSAVFADAVNRAREKGIDVCAHVIIGLPGETLDDMLRTVRFLSDLPVWGVKFHQLQVLKGTRLEEMYNNGEVSCLPLAEYVAIVVECLELLPPNVVIHRLSSDAPLKYIVAPKWGINKFIIISAIEKLMVEKKTFQGAKYRG